MLNHVVGFVLRYWHSFWTPVKAWADYHQDHSRALQLFASAATIIALPLLTVLVLIAVALLIIDRIEARRQRASRRRAVLLGLAAELQGTRDATSHDVAMFGPGGADLWTVLPHVGVEKALIEAGLLDLTPEQILELCELRLRISKANSLVHARLAVPRHVSGIRGEPPMAGGDWYNCQIRDQFRAISALCETLLAGLVIAENHRSLEGSAGEGRRGWRGEQRGRERGGAPAPVSVTAIEPNLPQPAAQAREESSLRL